MKNDSEYFRKPYLLPNLMVVVKTIRLNISLIKFTDEVLCA